jgi:hypothetical protein
MGQDMAENTLRYHDPEALVQTDWLEAHRGDADLRIFDCTEHLMPAEAGTDAPYRIVSGKAEYDAAQVGVQLALSSDLFERCNSSRL